jgi:hypothetical protein
MKEAKLKEGHLFIFGELGSDRPTREWDLPTLQRLESAIQRARENGLEEFGFLHDDESVDIYNTRYAEYFAQWLRHRLNPVTYQNRTAA